MVATRCLQASALISLAVSGAMFASRYWSMSLTQYLTLALDQTSCAGVDCPSKRTLSQGSTSATQAIADSGSSATSVDLPKFDADLFLNVRHKSGAERPAAEIALPGQESRATKAPIRVVQTNTRGCFSHDCPLDYDLAEVNRTADKLRGNGSEAAKIQMQAHEAARQACGSSTHFKNVLSTGGYCYNAQESQLVRKSRDSDVEFLLPRDHVLGDTPIVRTLLEEILLTRRGTCCYSISDFGAGVGQLGHLLKARQPRLQYFGYDGGGNVEAFTNGFVRFADLSKPMNATRTDWVISAEVGEHIPHAYESQFITNLHAHNCRGVILTWGVLTQRGRGHINCHSSRYILKLMSSLGYQENPRLTALVRARSFRSKQPALQAHSWFVWSAHVFDRISIPRDCPD